jgi:hypothetical protein
MVIGIVQIPRLAVHIHQSALPCANDYAGGQDNTLGSWPQSTPASIGWSPVATGVPLAAAAPNNRESGFSKMLVQNLL